MSTTEQTTIELVYAIEHPRPGFPGETWRMTYGTRRQSVDDVPALAVDVARTARAVHTYDGPFTVYVWRARADENHRMPIPDNAANYHFPAGWTGADGCGWDNCQHGCKDA